MTNAEQINKAVSPERIVDFLCHRLSATATKQSHQWEIHGQGGLYVDEEGRIAKPSDGKSAGGFGIISAMIYAETGKFKASGEIFKNCLHLAAQEAGIPIQNPSQHHKQNPPIDFNNPTKIYSYTDEEGRELYQNCRYEWIDNDGSRQKTFRQRQQKDGKWTYTLDGVRHVPYQLQKLLAEPDLICDVEGEKDAETLLDLGLTATNMAKLKDDEFKIFADIGKGKTIAVFEDNDKPGKESAECRARIWYKAGAQVKIITFREMPEKSDVTDWLTSDPSHDVFTLKGIINNATIYHPLSDILISFAHVPTRRVPIVKIYGQHLASEGEIFGIVSGIGTGKSHLMEMFAALLINPDCEPESHTEIELAEDEKCILIDNERTEDDCFYALQRIWHRIGQHPDTLTQDHQFFRQFHIAHTTHLQKEERRIRLLEAMETPDIKLMLLDGALGFIGDPNDTKQCIEFVEWLHMQANKHNIAIVYTIHGNRNDESGKGKGWLGAELQRLSATFLRLMRHPNNPDIRLLTSEFSNVKVRQGKDSGLTIAMEWSDEHHDFKCIPVPGDSGKPSIEELFTWTFAKENKLKMPLADLCKSYVETANVSRKTAYRHIEQQTGKCLILEGGFYRLAESVF
jgi:hypothetical protein